MTRWYQEEFNQTYVELISILKPFNIVDEKETFPNSFHKTTITLTPKPYKDITKNFFAIISNEYKCRYPQQIVTNKIQIYIYIYIKNHTP